MLACSGLEVPKASIYGASGTYLAAMDMNNNFILLLFHEKESPLDDSFNGRLFDHRNLVHVSVMFLKLLKRNVST